MEIIMIFNFLFINLLIQLVSKFNKIKKFKNKNLFFKEICLDDVS